MFQVWVLLKLILISCNDGDLNYVANFQIKNTTPNKIMMTSMLHFKILQDCMTALSLKISLEKL